MAMDEVRELCDACAKVMQDGYVVEKVSYRDHDIKCAMCKQKRSGATYKLTSKRRIAVEE